MQAAGEQQQAAGLGPHWPAGGGKGSERAEEREVGGEARREREEGMSREREVEGVEMSGQAGGCEGGEGEQLCASSCGKR